MLGTWLSARVLSSFEMIFKTVYIDRERYGMDTGPLGVLCSFWHQDLGSGAFVVVPTSTSPVSGFKVLVDRLFV